MSSWDIDPTTVSSILNSEKDLAENDLTDALNDVSTEADSAMDTCLAATTLNPGGEAQLVASAIYDWFSLHQEELTGLGTTVVNVTTNTADAVQSYLDHDEDSALEFQRAAT